MKLTYLEVLTGIITFLVILFILLPSVIIHEYGHYNEAKKLNINLNFKQLNLAPNLSSLGSWGQGRVEPSTKEDCTNFNELSLEDKQKITHAGVKYEIFYFSFIFLIYLSIYLRYIKGLANNNRRYSMICLTLILLTILLGIFCTLKGNVFSTIPFRDWNVFQLQCS